MKTSSRKKPAIRKNPPVLTVKRAEPDKIFCVISHTHWDREWHMSFDRFRRRLVDLIDNLLDVVKKQPKYIFHLDAQSITVEDYLVIRPQNEALLKRYIFSGNILIGPWYVQNDFYLTSGEATIRNLIIGSKMARDWGRCTSIGYAPDQFGNNPQLPQILQSFGIDDFIFGRGYSPARLVDGHWQKLPQKAEFIWRGTDGSELLAVHMPFWYNNAQRFPADIGKSLKYLESIEKSFENMALTPYLLLMNGVDHLEAQENLLPIMKEMNKRLGTEKTMRQVAFPEYLSLVKKTFSRTSHQRTCHLYRRTADGL